MLLWTMGYVNDLSPPTIQTAVRDPACEPGLLAVAPVCNVVVAEDALCVDESVVNSVVDWPWDVGVAPSDFVVGLDGVNVVGSAVGGLAGAAVASVSVDELADSVGADVVKIAEVAGGSVVEGAPRKVLLVRSPMCLVSREGALALNLCFVE
eukprot:gb/GFBE01005863.1/.p2 GENE.gb/GFBE01005863.1/~~gb/GFBE01005863.1/.p2  ORF type:complete len:152 (-),score=22.89 gb/GFBE01005863.1/:69-524(-)